MWLEEPVPMDLERPAELVHGEWAVCRRASRDVARTGHRLAEISQDDLIGHREKHQRSAGESERLPFRQTGHDLA